MKKNSDNSKLIERLKSVQQNLSSESLDSPLLLEAAAGLMQFGEFARESGREDLWSGAGLLSQVAEVAANDAAATESGQVDDKYFEFIINNILALDDAIAKENSFEQINSFIQQAKDQWPGQFSSPADKLVSPHTNRR